MDKPQLTNETRIAPRRTRSARAGDTGEKRMTDQHGKDQTDESRSARQPQTDTRVMTLKGIQDERRKLIALAATKCGMTLSEWVNSRMKRAALQAQPQTNERTARLQETIVKLWHDTNADHGTLRECLDMTFEEYTAWVSPDAMNEQTIDLRENVAGVFEEALIRHGVASEILEGALDDADANLTAVRAKLETPSDEITAIALKKFKQRKFEDGYPEIESMREALQAVAAHLK